MQEIYDNIKKGWKVALGQEAGELARSYVFDNDWNITDEVIDQLTERLCNSYFAVQAMALTDDELAIKRFKQLLRDKIKDGFVKFANQRATPKQIYYYISLCLRLGVGYEELTTNIEIHKEINRLLAILEENEG